MAIEKPASVARDPFKSSKWDELTAGRKFKQCDVSALTLLVQWYAVVQQCIDDMDGVGGQVAYQNDLGDLKALPQISTMKQASAEIRQLNKQLGIIDTSTDGEAEAPGANILHVIAGRRAQRGAGAANIG